MNNYTYETSNVLCCLNFVEWWKGYDFYDGGLFPHYASHNICTFKHKQKNIRFKIITQNQTYDSHNMIISVVLI